IYLPGKGETHVSTYTIAHDNPAVTEYRGFGSLEDGLEAIGGITPRFRNLSLWGSAGTLRNYYNPDDFALASWKLDQAMKPRWKHDPILAGWRSETNLNYGAVQVSAGGLWDIFLGATASPLQGFERTGYVYVSSTDTIDRIYFDQAFQEARRVSLSFASDSYEMFAFGASSIVAAVGGVNSMAGL